MAVIKDVFERSKFPITVLNITQLSEYRKDAHTAIYKKQWSPLTQEQLNNPVSYADCVHWCLPGLQDTWNEILFAKIFYPQKVEEKIIICSVGACVLFTSAEMEGSITHNDDMTQQYLEKRKKLINEVNTSSIFWGNIENIHFYFYCLKHNQAEIYYHTHIMFIFLQLNMLM